MIVLEVKFYNVKRWQFASFINVRLNLSPNVQFVTFFLHNIWKSHSGLMIEGGAWFDSHTDSQIFLSRKSVPCCFSSPRCITGYPDRAFFVQV